MIITFRILFKVIAMRRLLTNLAYSIVIIDSFLSNKGLFRFTFSLLKNYFRLLNMTLDTKAVVWFGVHISSQITFSFLNSGLPKATLTCI